MESDFRQVKPERWRMCGCRSLQHASPIATTVDRNRSALALPGMSIGRNAGHGGPDRWTLRLTRKVCLGVGVAITACAAANRRAQSLHTFFLPFYLAFRDWGAPKPGNEKQKTYECRSITCTIYSFVIDGDKTTLSAATCTTSLRRIRVGFAARNVGKA